MRRNTSRVMTGEAPANWLGANFWSRTGGPLMWRRYDPAVVSAELAVLRRHGLTMTRSFFYWPDFMPGPYEIDEAMTARFADFLDRHTEHRLSTIPTFIVGHMSGENWDPAWRNDRHLYNDVWLVGRQAWFAAEMVRRFHAHPAVAGWLVSNEMPLYGGADTDHEVVAAWARIIRDAVRAAGGHQPFSLGDGAWGIEVTGNDNGFRLTEVSELTDFLGPHIYPVGDDPIRQRYAAAVACELSGTFGKPVILEEFGVSSDFASDVNAATYYRHVLHSTLLAAYAPPPPPVWNNTDFALPALVRHAPGACCAGTARARRSRTGLQDDWWARRIAAARALARPPAATPHQPRPVRPARSVHGRGVLRRQAVTGSGPGTCGQRDTPDAPVVVGSSSGAAAAAAASPTEHVLLPAPGYALLVMDSRGQGGRWSSGATPDEAPPEPARRTLRGHDQGASLVEDYYYTRMFTDAALAVDTAIELAASAFQAGTDGKPYFYAADRGDRRQPGWRARTGRGGAFCARTVRCHADVPFLCDIQRAITLAPPHPCVLVPEFLAEGDGGAHVECAEHAAVHRLRAAGPPDHRDDAGQRRPDG